ncbi:IclR family transcriptional regulator [Aquamicrobium defluvii]|uniref:IclR family transcriptional regulator n=2 Tax=Aquamicrobium defluvii TaxID=69279 RepID=A0A4R6YDK5_9HYPH|nr:IclR family transcriptional regulator C-terminal domain-containing protein [Aquamicrobium defluvii]EZQ15309.1 transcriptional regulator [Halopseudomonas bauzanensis]TDR33930.1 IclR family transcriptional regulator [Aquamicrobium defluvii]
MRMNEKPKNDSPLERYTRILEIISGFPSGISLTQIADVIDLPKTTVHRLLKGLVKVGLLTFHKGEGGSYKAGPRFLRMLYAGAPHPWVEGLTRPILKRLANETGEACLIARLNDNKIRMAVLVEPDNAERGYVVPPRELWPHATAAAKAILAFQPREVVEAMLPKPLPRLTERTHTNIEELFAEFEEIRASGVAICAAEDVSGFAAIACPINVPEIGVIFSVGLTGTLQSIIEERRLYYERQLKFQAERLAASIHARLSTGGSPDEGEAETAAFV